MEFYDVIRIGAGLYCVVRAIKYKKNPVWWGIFGLILPWVAVPACFFILRKNKKTDRDPLQKFQQRQKKATLSKNKKNKLKTALKEKAELNNLLDNFKKTKTQSIEVEEIASEPVKVINKPPLKVKDNKPKNVEIKPTTIKKQEVVIEKEVTKPKTIELPKVKEALPISEPLEISINPLEDFSPIEEVKNEDTLTIDTLSLALEAVEGCELDFDSLKVSLHGLSQIKYHKHCSHCDWVDEKNFTFLFSANQNQKNSIFICPSCMSEQQIEIVVNSITVEIEDQI